MPSFELITLTRDSFVVKFDRREYKIDGERYDDGTWQIFPLMVYRYEDGESRGLVDDDELRAAVVTALLQHWSEYDFPWTLVLPGN